MEFYHSNFNPTSELKKKYFVKSLIPVVLFILLFTPVTLIFGINVFLVVLAISLIFWIFTISYLTSKYYNSIWYQILENEIIVNRGFITKSKKIVPYRTITNVDIKVGPFDRIFKIGSIEVQTAGATIANQPEERLDGIPMQLVETIQELILSKVREFRVSPGISHEVNDQFGNKNISFRTDDLTEIKNLLRLIAENTKS